MLKEEIVKLITAQSDLSSDEIAELLEKPHVLRPAIGGITECGNNETKGDYALACFKLTQKIKKSPQAIASELAGQLKPAPDSLIASVKPAGGYINFFANPVKLTPLILEAIRQKGSQYGCSESGRGKTIVIDYSSPNIAKPFGIGHLRSTVIGHALYNIYAASGYKCVGLNYLGDWGTQFGMLIADYKRNRELYQQLLYKKFQFITVSLAERYAAYNEETKSNPDLLDQARLEFQKLEQGDPENLELWRNFKELSLTEFQRIYKLLGVEFDKYSGESEVNRDIDRVIGEIQRKGLSEISDGALVVKLEKYGMPPCLLRKSDGATLYAARDITAAVQRYETYKFHKLIYVVGADQKLHFRQVFKVLDLMGYDWAKDCVHVDFGLVRLSGEKMSTRKGQTVLLEEVLDKTIELSRLAMQNRTAELKDKVEPSKVETVARTVGIGAVVFNDLKNQRIKDVDFNWEQILSFDGETGPYLQYTHTRLASLMKKYDSSLPPAGPGSEYKLPEEVNLIKQMGDFPEIIQRAADKYEPSIISNYLLNLAGSFNRYYRYHRIISDDAVLTQSRITLGRYLQQIISQGLNLLGIKLPEAM
ncbi:MAG: arginine--tRNA ligase [Planctomycetota bacterium]